MAKKSILFVGIPDNVKTDFYDTIREFWGYDRANLRKATEEAIKDWIYKMRKEKEEKLEITPKGE